MLLEPPKPYFRRRCAGGGLALVAKSPTKPSRKSRPGPVRWVWLAAALLASPLAADSFYTVTPCRVLDLPRCPEPALFGAMD
jgi:hypothetical protein